MSKESPNPLAWPAQPIDSAMIVALADHELSTLQEKSGIGIWWLDLTTRKIRWSQKAAALHNLSGVSQIYLRDVVDAYQPDDRREVLRKFLKAAEHGEWFGYVAEVLRPDGTCIYVRCVGDPVEEDGVYVGMRGIVQDVTDNYESYATLKHASRHDVLTGVLNRRGFDSELTSRMGNPDPWRSRFDLVMVDLDNFKDVNDFHGHLVGDAMLREAARRLKDTLPDDFLVARWGGDEFAIVTPWYVSRETGDEMVARVMQCFVEPIVIGDRRVDFGGSCGIASFSGSGTSRELIRQADLALYHAKRCDRGGAVRFAPEFDTELFERQTSIDRMREALQDRRIVGAYQPIVDLRDGKLLGLEALMRLRDTAGKLVPASQVLGALSDATISKAVCQTMLEGIVTGLPALSAGNPDLQFVSINITQADIFRRGFVMEFMSAFEKSGVDPGLVTIELTETVLTVDDRHRLREVLGALRSCGITIALDDFGTGFSSLAHLRDLPISKIKIDKSFTGNLAEEDSSREIVRATIAMANALGIDVVAEGVETAAARDQLLEMGCRIGQGFFYSKALPVERLADYRAEIFERS